MGTYFSMSSSGQRRFWYVDGLTSDEFYSADGMKADINWTIHRELTENGYKRIVFYNTNKRFYCYDNDSFGLFRDGKPVQQERSNVEPNRRGQGLKKGKWGRKSRPVEENPPKLVKPAPEQAYHVAMNPQGENALHQGIMDNHAVLMQMRAMMLNSSVTSAVVIDDADNFVHSLAVNDEWKSFMNEVIKLPSENVNIMILVFPDSNSGAPVVLDNLVKDNDVLANLNSISILQPNSSEICNMLNYFRLTKGLRIKVNELPEVAKEITRCIAKITQDSVEATGMAQGVRIRFLYHLLENFIRTGQVLEKDNCYKIFSEEYNIKKIPSAEQLLNSMIGMEEVKKNIVEKFRGQNPDKRGWLKIEEANRIKPPAVFPAKSGYMHIALKGNPGTGKTTVAKLLGQYFSEFGYLRTGHVVETDRSGLVAGYVGQTAIKTMEAVQKARGGVLFIDEAYALKQDEHDTFGQECIDTLIKAMDQYRSDLLVVFAGYPDEMDEFLTANAGFKRRIREEITIEDYTPDEMNRILVKMLRDRNLRLSDDLARRMPDFCENWVNTADENWGNAGEAEKLAEDMENEFIKDESAVYEGTGDSRIGIAEERHIPEKYRVNLLPISEVRANAVNDIKSMPGLQGVKDEIENIENKIIVGQISEPGHYAFLGAPGTGKTTVARKMGMLFRSHNVLKRGHLIEVSSGQLIEEVNKNSGNFNAFANKALDGVLFIDEAYQLMNTANGRDIIDSLVKFMEDNRKRVCVIVAGYDDDMNDMFRKANAGFQSRISKRIHFDNYNGDELFSILGTMLESYGLKADDDYMELSHRAIVRYAELQENNQRFGNARYIRDTYLRDSKDKLAERLRRTYNTRENIPEEARNLLTGEDIPENLVRFTKYPLEAPDTRTVIEKIDSLIGFKMIKEQLHKLILLAESQRNDTSGAKPVDINLNWIIKGNPGTGKTMIAKLLGEVYKEYGLLPYDKVWKVTRSDLVAGYQGQTAMKTRNWIEKAMGSVLFIDEAYALNSGDNDSFGHEAINELTEAMTDHRGEIAVVAVGYPNEMDRFISANSGLASRFDVFTIEDYTASELADIFRGKCRKSKFELSPEFDRKLESLFETFKTAKSKVTDWANGRETENLFQDMQMNWLEKHLNTDDARVLSEENIPQDYHKYISDLPDESDDGKTDFRVEAEYLPEPFASFTYPDDLPNVEQGVAFIVTEGKGGISYGTGFLMTEDGYIITCNHVVAGADKVKVRLKVRRKGRERLSWHNAEVIRTDKEIDAALLKIEVMGFPELPMSADDIKTSDGIFLLGYPFGAMLSDNLDSLALSKSSGEVSSVQIRNGIERVFANIEAKSGCSGGPVFSMKTGSIIGILCGSQTSQNGNLVEEINYILPVKYIFERFTDSEDSDGQPKISLQKPSEE
ncbi:MAG: AAA family ATPase [Ruminococcus flavefaciens]|nr:AAA family ATPase [Ruminococcus flavefaciens]MCM1228571.1 AAA family ATPase [Ruminococcus flavefaciens]